MATLLERFNLQYSDSPLRQRTQIAIESAAFDVINEATDAPNHVNRLLWANWTLNNPAKMMDVEMSLVVQNPTISAAGDDATDGDIQFVVNGLVDTFGNAIASGALKLE